MACWPIIAAAALRLKAILAGAFDAGGTALYFTSSAPPARSGTASARVFSDKSQSEICWPLGKASLLAMAAADSASSASAVAETPPAEVAGSKCVAS